MPQARQDESPEYVFTGPFGGVQSEVSLGQIGNTAFVEVQNVMLRKSQARSFIGFTSVVSPNGTEPIMGIGDFFNANGTRIAVVWTPTKMYAWTSGTWTQITGTAFTGNTAQFFQWAVIGYKIFFSQNKDAVWVWDGITAGYSAVASSVPSKYMGELNFHLIAANNIVGGNPSQNTVYWSAAADGTTWTSYDSGSQNVFNNLGPITGYTKLFQSGFLLQQWGITQMVPTGIGLAPFQFIPMGAIAKGNILPYSLASFGELISCYVGKDDVYIFDGTSSQGIGSKPIDGNRRLGARNRIFTDLFTAIQTNIFGFILTTANGFEYESYWLFIPSLNKAWVYYFDEQTWTQAFFGPSVLGGPVGVFPLQQVPRIKDLIGTILAQGWSPSSLTNANQLDTMVISVPPGFNIYYLDPGIPFNAPTSGSIFPSDGWYIKSGQISFDDTRHAHTVKAIRLVVEDIGANMVFNIRLTNEYGYQPPVQTITVGTGSGNMITSVIPIPNQITGKWITIELSGPSNLSFAFNEITLMYEESGEVRANNQ